MSDDDSREVTIKFYCIMLELAMFEKTNSQRQMFGVESQLQQSLQARLKASWAEVFNREILPILLQNEDQFSTLYGATGRPNFFIASHVERKSRFLIAAKLPDKKADTMTQKSIRAFWRVPKAIRKTRTADNGKQFSLFRKIEAKTGPVVYFDDPYAAWQRGLNENTNKLLRQYFSKAMGFRKLKDRDLALKVKLINSRPGKCLNYQTSQEACNQAWRGALVT